MSNTRTDLGSRFGFLDTTDDTEELGWELDGVELGGIV